MRARYVRTLDRLIQRASDLDDRTLRGIMKLLHDARKAVTATIANTDWRLVHFDVLRRRIEGTLRDVGQQLGTALRDYEGRKWSEGAEVTDDLLARFGGEAERLRLPLDRRQLATLQDYSADLITEVSQQTIAKVSSRLRLGMLGGKSPSETIADIGRSLVHADGSPAPGIWGDTLTRAEVVYRTEANRVYSVSTQARYEQHDRARPGLKKLWLHSGKPTGRPSHIEAGRDYGPGGDPGPIPQDKPFILHVGYEESDRQTPAGEHRAMYPRDPRLPASLSVMCGCAMAPWRDSWEGLA